MRYINNSKNENGFGTIQIIYKIAFCIALLFLELTYQIINCKSITKYNEMKYIFKIK